MTSETEEWTITGGSVECLLHTAKLYWMHFKAFRGKYFRLNLRSKGFAATWENEFHHWWLIMHNLVSANSMSVTRFNVKMHWRRWSVLQQCLQCLQDVVPYLFHQPSPLIIICLNIQALCVHLHTHFALQIFKSDVLSTSAFISLSASPKPTAPSWWRGEIHGDFWVLNQNQSISVISCIPSFICP